MLVLQVRDGIFEICQLLLANHECAVVHDDKSVRPEPGLHRSAACGVRWLCTVEQDFGADCARAVSVKGVKDCPKELPHKLRSALLSGRD